MTIAPSQLFWFSWIAAMLSAGVVTPESAESPREGTMVVSWWLPALVTMLAVASHGLIRSNPQQQQQEEEQQQQQRSRSFVVEDHEIEANHYNNNHNTDDDGDDDDAMMKLNQRLLDQWDATFWSTMNQDNDDNDNNDNDL